MYTNIQFFLALFIGRQLFLWISCAPLCKLIVYGSISNIYLFFPLFSLSILMSVPHSLDYYSLVSLELSINPRTFFFFKVVLFVLDSFAFHMDFRISLTIFNKMSVGILIRIELNLRSVWGEFTCKSYTLSSSTWTQSFYFMGLNICQHCFIVFIQRSYASYQVYPFCFIFFMLFKIL